MRRRGCSTGTADSPRRSWAHRISPKVRSSTAVSGTSAFPRSTTVRSCPSSKRRSVLGRRGVRALRSRSLPSGNGETRSRARRPGERAPFARLPLNKKEGVSSGFTKSFPSVQHIQKSFSTISGSQNLFCRDGDVCRRPFTAEPRSPLSRVSKDCKVEGRRNLLGQSSRTRPKGSRVHPLAVDRNTTRKFVPGSPTSGPNHCFKPSLQDRVFEVHPEVSFCALHGSPMKESKKSKPGLEMQAWGLHRAAIGCS